MSAHGRSSRSTWSDTIGDTRTDVTVSLTSSASRVAAVDRFGFLTLLAVGTVEITATAEDVSDTLSIEVEANPVSSLELQASVETARTGDVVRFTAIAKDARGLPVRGVPVQFGVGGQTAPDIIAAGAAAQIADDGRFVAERSGTYTVVASTGSHSAARTVSIERRDVRRAVELVGRGKVLDRHTSDLWIWEGTDGRDYAITGTWGADGHSYIWDVTDPRQHREAAGSPGRRTECERREGVRRWRHRRHQPRRRLGPEERDRRARCRQPARRGAGGSPSSPTN